MSKHNRERKVLYKLGLVRKKVGRHHKTYTPRATHDEIRAAKAALFQKGPS